MTTLDHSRHVLRRKAYAGHYNPNNLVHFQNQFHESTVELLQVRILPWHNLDVY